MKTEKFKSAVKIKDQINYWDGYYRGDSSKLMHSSFAEYCLPLIKKKSTLLELGCGNGRDSFYFAKNNLSVVATDISKIALKNNLKRLPKELKNRLKFVNADFTNLKIHRFNESFSSVYSRFTFHAILKEKVEIVLKLCYKILCNDGLIFIETRSINDPLFNSGIGEKIANNTFIYEKGHLRQFIEKKDLVYKLTNVGFKIVEVTESNNLSVVGTDNPVLIRIIAKK